MNARILDGSVVAHVYTSRTRSVYSVEQDTRPLAGFRSTTRAIRNMTTFAVELDRQSHTPPFMVSSCTCPCLAAN